MLRRAQRDLQQIYDYLATEAPDRADTFIDSLLEVIESLDEHSERGSVPRDPVLQKRRYRYLVHRKYLIFYKVFAKSVRVYRVVYGKQAYSHLLR